MKNEQFEQSKKTDWFEIKTKSKSEHKISLSFDDSASVSDVGELKIDGVKKKKVKADDVRVLNKLREKKIEEVINELPKEKEYFHIISDGSFDYFKIIKRILEIKEGNFILYASTWTMNYCNVDELLSFIKLGRLKEVCIITGEYLRQQEPLVFETLKQGLYESGVGRLNAFKNHCKIIAMTNGEDYFVCEGSANFTANPRAEQHIITNNKEVYEFHKDWMNNTFGS